MTNPLTGLKRFVRARRDAWPWFDHLARAGSRYKGDGGDRLAAGLTMYAILALLPLLLVSMSILGFVLAHDPERQQRIFTSISGALPGVGTQLSRTLTSVKSTRATTGLLGLAGLLFSGLGGVDALRDALRIMWHQSTDAGNFVKKKLTDALTVGLIGVTLVVSFGVSALATGGAGALLTRAGIGGVVSRVLLYVLSFCVGVLVDAALFLVLFKWLPRVDWPLRRLVRGALFGGVAFGVLKLVGGWYVGRTATRSTALYGSIGTAVAVLVGLYLVSRVILFTAAWTVTAPGWDDVEPSGTASPQAAAEAGVPLGARTGSGRDPHGEPGSDDGRKPPGGTAGGATGRKSDGKPDSKSPDAKAPDAKAPDRKSPGRKSPARAGKRESRALLVPAFGGFAATALALLGLALLRARRAD
jgi:membrane protein